MMAQRKHTENIEAMMKEQLGSLNTNSNLVKKKKELNLTFDGQQQNLYLKERMNQNRRD